MDKQKPAGRQIAAARTLVGMTQAELAAKADISIPTLKRMEGSNGPAAGMPNNVDAVRRALEAEGIRFTLDADGTPGIQRRLPGGGAVEGPSALQREPRK
ncbi:helix-turn-helix domain-containing protein [Methylocella sp.]|uniref:helix-turn-helix domain-containing protein n=1 Tax=Methylocella sp. TaxID=1978226 RepID=UPI003C2233C6